MGIIHYCLSLFIHHFHKVVEVLGVALGDEPLSEVALQCGVQVLHHVVVEVALPDLDLQVTIIFVSRVQLHNVLLRGQQLSHFPFLWLLLLFGLAVLLLRQDQQIELSRWHFVPRVLVTDHLLEQHLLKVAVVGLAERDIGGLEVFGELRGGAVVGSDVD